MQMLQTAQKPKTIQLSLAQLSAQLHDILVENAELNEVRGCLSTGTRWSFFVLRRTGLDSLPELVYEGSKRLNVIRSPPTNELSVERVQRQQYIEKMFDLSFLLLPPIW